MTRASGPTAPKFQRNVHLLFAGFALLHAPLLMRMWEVMPLFVDRYPWTAQAETVEHIIPLCFVAAIAWLAFDGFDTGSGVSVLPKRWRDVGLIVIVVFAIREAAAVAYLWQLPPARIDELAANWTAPFTGGDGDLMLGWLILSVFAGAIAEELVYRALLLRALEGYMNRWIALTVQALVFELVHVFIYDRGFQGGGWFVAGLIYGYAFQRTRSLAVPALLHAAANLLFFIGIWYLAR